MAETSGLGHAGGGFTPAGTPHYSKYYSYGFYRSRARPRSMAWAYLLGAMAAVPLLLPSRAATFGARPAVSKTMSQTVADRWSKKEFAKGFAWEAVPVYGSARNVVAVNRLAGGPVINRAMLSRTAGSITGQVFWTAAYTYAAKSIATRVTDRVQGASDSLGSRGGSRRRRFEYEYAYKF